MEGIEELKALLKAQSDRAKLQSERLATLATQAIHAYNLPGDVEDLLMDLVYNNKVVTDNYVGLLPLMVQRIELAETQKLMIDKLLKMVDSKKE